MGDDIYADLMIDNILVPTHTWRERSREWTSHSSTSHFLFRRSVDRMR